VRRRARLTWLIAALALTACAPPQDGNNPFAHGVEPLCSAANETMTLIAQSVQSATRLPCVAGYPAGWSFLDKDVRRSSTTYWLTSSVVGVGSRPVEIRLVASCDPQGDPFTDPRAVGADMYRATSATGETNTYVFDGGCVIERIDLPPETTAPTLIAEARSTLGFLDRERLAERLEAEYGVRLCGAGAAPCEG
jgi:hypothetical protein